MISVLLLLAGIALLLLLLIALVVAVAFFYAVYKGKSVFWDWGIFMNGFENKSGKPIGPRSKGEIVVKKEDNSSMEVSNQDEGTEKKEDDSSKI